MPSFNIFFTLILELKFNEGLVNVDLLIFILCKTNHQFIIVPTYFLFDTIYNLFFIASHLRLRNSKIIIIIIENSEEMFPIYLLFFI